MHERRRHPKEDFSPRPTQVAAWPTSAAFTKKLPRRFVRRKGSSFGFLPSLELGLWSSRALLLAVAGMYSTNFASVKYLETMCVQPPCQHDPAEIAFCRFLVSAMVCLPILYMNRKQLPLIKAGLEVGCSVSINYICQAQALELIPAGKCCFIGTLAVAVVPIFNGIFLGKPIKPMNLVSAFIALLGVAILENIISTGIGSSVEATDNAAGTSSSFFGGLGKGDLLAMGQPIGFGYSVMRIDYYLEKYSHLPNRVLTITAAQCVSVCVITFLWVLYDNGGSVPDLSYMIEPHHLLALGWTGIVTSVGAITLQGIALQKAGATDAALIFCTEPIMASLFAGWLLNETPAASTYVGGAVIVAACVLGSLGDVGGGGGPVKKKKLQTKSSNVFTSEDEDSSFLSTSLLPMLNYRSKTVLKSDTSLPSLTDVQDFPTRTASRDLHALI